MKLSIVIPVLNEAGNLEPLYERLNRVVPTLAEKWEVIFVEGGSMDTTCSVLVSLHKRNPHIKALLCSRNFGHQAALTAGLDVADGDAVVLMDADLQHPPEMIQALLERWREGYEIVHTEPELDSRGFNLRVLASSFFYRIFRRFTGIDLPFHAADFRILDKKVVQALRSLRERTRFLRGMTAWVGYRVISVPYRQDERHSGKTKYSWTKLIRFALDGLVSFSTAPLYWAVYAGFLLSGLGVLEIIYALATRFINHHVVPGWASLIIWVSLIGGLQLVLMGVSGIYMAKIYEEVKQRPLYLIRQRLGDFGRSPSDSS